MQFTNPQVLPAILHPHAVAAHNFPTLRSCLQSPHSSGAPWNIPTPQSLFPIRLPLKNCMQLPHPSEGACNFPLFKSCPSPQVLHAISSPSGPAWNLPTTLVLHLISPPFNRYFQFARSSRTACNCPTPQKVHAISHSSSPAFNFPTPQVPHAISPPSGPACNYSPSYSLLQTISPPLKRCIQISHPTDAS